MTYTTHNTITLQLVDEAVTLPIVCMLHSIMVHMTRARALIGMASLQFWN